MRVKAIVLGNCVGHLRGGIDVITGKVAFLSLQILRGSEESQEGVGYSPAESVCVHGIPEIKLLHKELGEFIAEVEADKT